MTLTITIKRMAWFFVVLNLVGTGLGAVAASPFLVVMNAVMTIVWVVILLFLYGIIEFKL